MDVFGVKSNNRQSLRGPSLIRDGMAGQALSPQIKNTPGGKTNGVLVEQEVFLDA